MTDSLSPAKRSELMSRIQGGISRNKVERTVHYWLKAVHFRHKMNPKLEGSPDARIETPNGPLFLFVDGCFWHVCPAHYRRPKTRQEFWVPHLEEANERRERIRARLPYRWLRVWEHQVRDGSYKVILAKAIRQPSERGNPGRPPRS